MIQLMNCLLTIAAVWATAVAPQLCRIGALTACCAGAPHQEVHPECSEPCAPGDCDHGCQEPYGNSAPSDNRDCGSCENFCGAALNPADARESTSQLHPHFLGCLPALPTGDCLLVDETWRSPAQLLDDIPHLPRPPSDFPLLN